MTLKGSEEENLLLGGGVARRDLGPVDDVKEGRNVVGATVLVLQVVGVLPYVEAEDGGSGAAHAWHDGVVLVGGRADFELAGGVDAKPCPA